MRTRADPYIRRSIFSARTLYYRPCRAACVHMAAAKWRWRERFLNKIQNSCKYRLSVGEPPLYLKIPGPRGRLPGPPVFSGTYSMYRGGAHR